jgi:hypothetical protein
VPKLSLLFHMSLTCYKDGTTRPIPIKQPYPIPWVEPSLCSVDAAEKLASYGDIVLVGKEISAFYFYSLTFGLNRNLLLTSHNLAESTDKKMFGWVSWIS